MWKSSNIFCVYLGHLPQPASDMAWTCRGSLGAPEWGSSKSCVQFFSAFLWCCLLAPLQTNHQEQGIFHWIQIRAVTQIVLEQFFFQHGEKKNYKVAKKIKEDGKSQEKNIFLSIFCHTQKYNVLFIWLPFLNKLSYNNEFGPNRLHFPRCTFWKKEN